jgi:hypothetical protein
VLVRQGSLVKVGPRSEHWLALWRWSWQHIQGFGEKVLRRRRCPI